MVQLGQAEVSASGPLPIPRFHAGVIKARISNSSAGVVIGYNGQDAFGQLAAPLSSATNGTGQSVILDAGDTLNIAIFPDGAQLWFHGQTSGDVITWSAL